MVFATIPHPNTANSGPMHHIEHPILTHHQHIEIWRREPFVAPAPLAASWGAEPSWQHLSTV